MKKIRFCNFISTTLIVILSFFIILTTWNVYTLQGTSRIINYAGIARGATQRLVKLEMANIQSSDLENTLDVILKELEEGGEVNNLKKIVDFEYSSCLHKQKELWIKLKKEIEKTREVGFENTNLVSMSEEYFELANNTVFAAEDYSQSIASVISVCEFCMVLLILIWIFLSFYIRRLNTNMYKEREDEIRKEAEYDALTKVLNRRAFDKILQYYEEGKAPFSLLIVDVDYFKEFNDQYGHLIGDEVLKRVANVLQNNFRSIDSVCRIGGDEFAIIMKNTHEGHREVLENKLNIIKNILNVSEEDIPPIHLSIGVAFSDSLSKNDSIFEAADKALYTVKENGRNGHSFYVGKKGLGYW